jgi:hypothetical protein
MRAVWPISVSERNPDALVVAQALQGTPKGDRSALLLRWAAAYLQGKANERPAIPELEMTDEEVSALLDDF